MNYRVIKNDTCESRSMYVVNCSSIIRLLMCLDSAKVWHSCKAITWISALSGLLWIFTIQSHMYVRMHPKPEGLGLGCIYVIDKPLVHIHSIRNYYVAFSVYANGFTVFIAVLTAFDCGLKL